MIAPVAPHIGEELWSKLGYNETITYASQHLMSLNL